MRLIRSLEYDVLDVFTNIPFSGNPLSIVHIPEDEEDITQAQKQSIAREFNFSETVFLHHIRDGDILQVPATTSTSSLKIDIFDPSSEIPFAGHPTIGTGWILLESCPGRESISLQTKAGLVPVSRDRQARKVRLRVPVDFKFHGTYHDPDIKSSSRLISEDFIRGKEAPEPVASIVKGMSFMLLELAGEDALGRFVPSSRKFTVGREVLGEWEGFTGLYLYTVLLDGKIRARMFEGSIEDPATGSAASTLAVYLAMEKGEGRWEFSITQGVEMGRRSEIEVTVEMGKDSTILSVELVGEAARVMSGKIYV
ncbi:hypothetical protein PQX77_014376 [Marasmius sp. AFHP31]|nr:hypothetical protein PQX77_014376 [Marasmius sp. AFHP31]